MRLTIVMYHYVRDLARTRFPDIKACDVLRFRQQLDYIADHHTVVTVRQILEALKGGDPLPENALWLTFDDGYLDHYTVVFPLLHQRGWQGSFFAPVRAVVHRELLDVNRIHFMLASEPDTGLIVEAIRRFVERHHRSGALRSFDEYWSGMDRSSPFDSEETIFIKRMLDYALPAAMGQELTRELFGRFVSVHPDVLAAELYMTPDQMKTMLRAGMYVGAHGDRHCWIDRLDPADQIAEVERSLEFLTMLGAPDRDWVMCYPYGGYSASLIDILKGRGCAIGLTTVEGVAHLGQNDPMLLPRVDTVNLPPRPGLAVTAEAS